MKKTALFALMLLLSTAAKGQRHELHSPDIATLQVVAGTRWMQLPVVQLGGNEPLNISFDDLTHEYHRYTYTIEHCEADWTPSEELFASDYIDGFSSGNTIDDSEESINTTVLYTHYRLQIPNEKCRIKMSGNYKLTVFDENDGNRPMLTACFMVVEPLMGVQMEVSANTDIDINMRHQQVSMSLSYGNLSVTVPEEQIKTVVLQNMRWDQARQNARPQYVMANGLKWLHCRELIFKAGNEYHKHEVLDVDHPSMGIEHIGWDGEQYHAYPFISEPRRNYIYDEDANGAFFIRNSDNIENDRSSDYVLVHYRLHSPVAVNGDVYVNAVWTNDRFLPEYRLTYNAEEQLYEAVIRQKLGYYSYQYVMMDDAGSIQTMPTEGDFYQTENSYQALVYYRGIGDRTDRLVGYQAISYK